MLAWIATVIFTLIGDNCLLCVLQVILFFLLILAELLNAGYLDKPTGAQATVIRGRTSWNYLNCAFGIITINILQIINSADDSVKFKVLMSLFDLAVMIRLFFFNGWFRNFAIGIVGKSKGLQEGGKAKS